MREIKFRAWDRVDNKIKRITRLDFPEWSVAVQDDNTYYGSAERNSFKNEESDVHFLMQYTNYNDIKGIELYEGDIVIHDGIVCEIKYDEICACFTVGEEMLGDANFARLEVIGNIYENPELLKEQ